MYYAIIELARRWVKTRLNERNFNMNFKKIIAMTCSLALCAAVLTACGGADESVETTTAADTTVTEEVSETESETENAGETEAAWEHGKKALSLYRLHLAAQPEAVMQYESEVGGILRLAQRNERMKNRIHS